MKSLLLLILSTCVCHSVWGEQFPVFMGESKEVACLRLKQQHQDKIDQAKKELQEACTKARINNCPSSEDSASDLIASCKEAENKFNDNNDSGSSAIINSLSFAYGLNTGLNMDPISLGKPVICSKYTWEEYDKAYNALKDDVAKTEDKVAEQRRRMDERLSELSDKKKSIQEELNKLSGELKEKKKTLKTETQDLIDNLAKSIDEATNAIGDLEKSRIDLNNKILQAELNYNNSNKSDIEIFYTCKNTVQAAFNKKTHSGVSQGNKYLSDKMKALQDCMNKNFKGRDLAYRAYKTELESTKQIGRNIDKRIEQVTQSLEKLKARRSVVEPEADQETKNIEMEIDQKFHFLTKQLTDLNNNLNQIQMRDTMEIMNIGNRTLSAKTELSYLTYEKPSRGVTATPFEVISKYQYWINIKNEPFICDSPSTEAGQSNKTPGAKK